MRKHSNNERPTCALNSRKSRGFTLIEVIIAMSLTSILMLLLWSLFSTYTKLERRSTRTATELQLVRSISQQLRSDLEHFAVLPVPANIAPSRGSNSRSNSDQDASETETDGEDDSNTPSDGSRSSSDQSSGTESSEEESAESESSVQYRSPITASSGSDATDATAPLVSTIGQSIAVDATFNEDDIYKSTLNASLPDATYLRGTATRLEFVTRLPYTVDVPTGRQLLGAETRYGTHQLVLYEWRDERALENLLRDDPVLNPSKWNPPKPLNPNDPPLVAMPLNPNDNVGLVREMKSWLHVTRDRRRDELKKQAAAAGLLVNGELPVADPRYNETTTSNQKNTQNDYGSNDQRASQLPPWHPPPEFRHKRDHVPEVTRLQFRYFNGDSWVLDWNENQLPLAVEVAFDLDPEAAAVRAKEFEEAHEAMLGGQSLTQVLPPENLTKEDELLDELDPFASLNLIDPTAIVTEYRFVILLPTSIDRNEELRAMKEGRESDGQDDSQADEQNESDGEEESESDNEEVEGEED